MYVHVVADPLLLVVGANTSVPVTARTCDAEMSEQAESVVALRPDAVVVDDRLEVGVAEGEVLVDEHDANSLGTAKAEQRTVVVRPPGGGMRVYAPVAAMSLGEKPRRVTGSGPRRRS